MARSADSRPTIRDVARLAGVSIQTVSNVVNERPVTRPETRERVERAIRELGYERDAVARALRVRRTATLGLLLEDESRLALRDPLHGLLLTGMVERARQRDYSVTVLVTTPATTERTVERIIRQRRVDGLVLSLQGAEGERIGFVERLASAEVPIVAFEQRMRIPGVCTVAADNEGGARRACRHLTELGHRRLAFLTGGVRWPAPELRLAGVRAEAAGAGAELAAWRAPEWEVEAARATARPLLADDPPTAVCAANDVLALGVVQAAEDVGLRVPDDLSVVGFDDFEFASFVRPALTTVRLDAVAMGEWAADALVDLAHGGDPVPDLLLPTRLVVRESTGPAAR
jgi:DNA-binding LacI/PurR family transcriptional regulator